MYKKKILFLTIISCFLFLTIPAIPTIECQEIKESQNEYITNRILNRIGDIDDLIIIEALRFVIAKFLSIPLIIPATIGTIIGESLGELEDFISEDLFYMITLLSLLFAPWVIVILILLLILNAIGRFLFKDLFESINNIISSIIDFIFSIIDQIIYINNIFLISPYRACEIVINSEGGITFIEAWNRAIEELKP